MITLVVGDIHPMVVDGIAHLVRTSGPEVRWRGAGASWPDVLELAGGPASGPRVVLVEPAIGPAHETEAAIRELTQRGVAVVVHTADLRPVPIRRAVTAGALGVVLKTHSRDAVLAVVRAAAAGTFTTSSEWARRLVSDARMTPQLSPREEEVLRLLAIGLPRKVIGRHMSPPVATTTVVTYLNRMCEKYREIGRTISCPADVLRLAAEDGYLDLGGNYPRGSLEAAS